jgi:hypothetical protein
MLVALLVAVGLASVAATAVQEQESSVDSTSAFHEMTDMRGRVVSVPTQIDSVVALGANSLRLLSYFDSVDKVVAVEDTGHAREKSVHDFFYLATYRIAHPELRELRSSSPESKRSSQTSMPGRHASLNRSARTRAG